MMQVVRYFISIGCAVVVGLVIGYSLGSNECYDKNSHAARCVWYIYYDGFSNDVDRIVDVLKAAGIKDQHKLSQALFYNPESVPGLMDIITDIHNRSAQTRLDDVLQFTYTHLCMKGFE